MQTFAIPSESLASGRCGKDAIWYIIDDTMYIKGIGKIRRKMRKFICSFSVHKIVIENGITEIGRSTFSLLDTRQSISEDKQAAGVFLESISIPNSVCKIRAFAFAGCVGLKHIILPETAKWIEESVFEGCTDLISIVLPERLYDISSRMFCECHSMRELTLPQNVSEIESEAFKNCYGLTKITIPEKVTSIGYGAFAGCKNVELLKIHTTCIEQGGAEFSLLSGLRKAELPDGIAEIYDYMFSGCVSLEEINIPDSITAIGNYAFFGCINLKRVTIPSSVAKIGVLAFENDCQIIQDGSCLDIEETIVDCRKQYIADEYLFFENDIDNNDWVLWLDNPKELPRLENGHDLKSIDLVLRKSLPEIGKSYIIAGGPCDIGTVFTILVHPDHESNLIELLMPDKLQECAVVWGKVISPSIDVWHRNCPERFRGSDTLKMVHVFNCIKVHDLWKKLPVCKVNEPLGLEASLKPVVVVNDTLEVQSAWPLVEVFCKRPNQNEHLVLYQYPIDDCYGCIHIGNLVYEDF